MWTAAPYCSGFDEAGNPKYAWDEGDADARLLPLYRILDYAESRHVDVMLGEWAPPQFVNGPGDPRWARIITDFVVYLTKRKHYTVIRYYNYMNEPNGNWMWPQGKIDYDAWAAGMRRLRGEFDSHDLESLPIAGPDNSGDWDWIDRCARELRHEVGLWYMHWYVKDKELADGDVEKLLTAKREMLLKTDPEIARKGIYMAEAGVITGRTNGDQQPRVKTFVYGVLMADFVAQTTRAGWMGASAWDLDDAMHVVNGLPHPVVPNDLTLKIWGFWNTQGRAMGHPEDEAIRPWFYSWSLMSRMFPKGARVLTGEAPVGVRVLASERGVMVVNDGDAENTITIRLPNGGTKTVAEYHYFEGDRPTAAGGFPSPYHRGKVNFEKGATVRMRSRGIVFLRVE